jgi:hypothetical protein
MKRFISAHNPGGSNLGATFGHGFLLGGIQKCAVYHMAARDKESIYVCASLVVSLPLVIKPPGFNYEVSTLITLSNPNHLPDVLRLRTIVRLNVYPFNIS